MKTQSSKMIVTIAVLVLTLSSLKSSHAQKSPPYLERFNLAAQIVTQTKPDAANHFATSQEVQAIQELLTLSTTQVQAAILKSARSLSNGQTGDKSGFQKLLVEGLQAGQNTSEVCANHTVAVIMGLLERTGWALQSELN